MYKVLIVEDEDIIRKGLMYMVDWIKVNCIVVGEAIDGRDGLIKIKELQPDIVITDIRMPFKDGIQMLEESICQYNYEAIIISGYGEFEYAQKAITLGVNEYLLKPLNFEELYKVIDKLTEKIESEKRLKDSAKSIEEINLYKDILDIKGYIGESNEKRYVIDMLDYIEKNYHRKISLSHLSEIYNLSTVYLNSKFKEETNYTFNDFLNRYRIIQSIRLLKDGDFKIYEIAELVGFQDYKYFSQVFRKYTGYSPTSFLNSF